MTDKEQMIEAVKKAMNSHDIIGLVSNDCFTSYRVMTGETQIGGDIDCYEDATGAYAGSCTCAAIKRREALDNLFASDADLIDVETEATQEGGWKEAGQPWLWTYDAHLKEKKP
jgi:hypothetical protein